MRFARRCPRWKGLWATGNPRHKRASNPLRKRNWGYCPHRKLWQFHRFARPKSSCWLKHGLQSETSRFRGVPLSYRIQQQRLWAPSSLDFGNRPQMKGYSRRKWWQHSKRMGIMRWWRKWRFLGSFLYFLSKLYKKNERNKKFHINVNVCRLVNNKKFIKK